MPGTDLDHWLHRLTSEEWLRAAATELLRARRALGGKLQRQGVAGARRAAGMAWNAVLVLAADESYGRSYMEHLRALAGDRVVPENVRAAAQALVDAELAPELVQLGPGDTRIADAAAAIVEHAQARVSPTAHA
jgi:hypothetical protein